MAWIKHLASRMYTTNGSCDHCYFPSPQLTSTLSKGDEYGVLLPVWYLRQGDRIIDGVRLPLDSRGCLYLCSSNSTNLFWSWVLCIRYKCL